MECMLAMKCVAVKFVIARECVTSQHKEPKLDSEAASYR